MTAIIPCKLCCDQGWVETWHGGSSGWTPSIQQCRMRCNLQGYSDEVQRRLNNPNHVTERRVLEAAPSEPRKPADVVRLHFHKDES